MSESRVETVAEAGFFARTCTVLVLGRGDGGQSDTNCPALIRSKLVRVSADGSSPTEYQTQTNESISSCSLARVANPRPGLELDWTIRLIRISWFLVQLYCIGESMNQMNLLSP